VLVNVLRLDTANKAGQDLAGLESILIPWRALQVLTPKHRQIK
jgi:hypothetical protein